MVWYGIGLVWHAVMQLCIWYKMRIKVLVFELTFISGIECTPNDIDFFEYKVLRGCSFLGYNIRVCL